MISSRLKSLVPYVDFNDKVIDIGCDHALLDIYLIQNKILNKIVVSDNKQTALENGIKNIKHYKLTKQIEPRLGDGIDVIDANIDTLIISGMGSHTIIKILESDKLKYIKKIITQSNNDYYLLRKSIVKNGFYISNESVVNDNNRYYINIVFEVGKKRYSKKELKYGPILINNNKEYFTDLLKKEIFIIKNIPLRRVFTRLKHRKEIIYLKRLSK